MLGFVNSLISLLAPTINAVNSFIQSVMSAFQNLFSVPGVFPSFWSVIPSSITSIFLGIFVIVTFIAVINAIARN